MTNANRRTIGAERRSEDALRQLPPKGVTTGAALSGVGADRRTGGASLTAVESAAFDRITKIASEGRAATQSEIRDSVGCTSGGVATAIVNRLVAKGYVEHVCGHQLQKAMWLRVVMSGHTTAQPKCTIPHWRTITDRVPVPAIHTVRSRDVSLAQWIEATARRLNRDYLDFSVELLKRGAQDYRAEQDEQC